MALRLKNEEVMDEWYEEKKGTTYIKVGSSFKNCAELGQQTSQK